MTVLKTLSTPIILFHGMGGAILRNTREEIIYPPSLSRFFFKTHDWKKQISAFDEGNDTLKTMGFGDKKSLDISSVSSFCRNKDYYSEFVKNENIHPAPFDFRKIHIPAYIEYDYFPRLKSYIESFKEPVVFFSHSTGGLVSHWFLAKQSREWKNIHIRSAVYVSVPFSGVVLVLKILLWPSFADRMVGTDILRKLGGFILNLPDPSDYVDDIIIPIVDYLRFFNLYDIEKKRKDSSELLGSLKHNTGVKTHIVYTLGNEPKTHVGYRIDMEKKKILSPILGIGDGVVSKESLLFPKKWANQERVFYHNIKDCSHSGILKSIELMEILKNT